jgi:uncharacterized protein (TIGR00297 family)
MAFFLSSTGLGYVQRREKERFLSIHEKGNRRDLFQVLANGGVGMITAVLFRLTGDPVWAAGLAVSIASSNADTWASELGELSRHAPVSLINFRPVPRGVSGGVSFLGCGAALAGALFIALLFALGNASLAIFSRGFLRLTAFVAAGGFLGSLADSLLGATLQAQYASQAEGAASAVTERRRAEDGTLNRLVRGLAFVNNDAVNFTSCAAAALGAVLLFPLLS